MTAKRQANRQAQKRTHTRGRDVWAKAFLSALRIHGNVSVASHVASIARSAVYERRDSDPAFKQAWDDALEEAGDWLEHEARRRAEEGSLKPVYFKGELVGYEREYSDQLMALMLKGTKPAKYGDKLTIQLAPEDQELLRKYGLTAGQAMERFIQSLKAAEAEVING